MKHISLKLRPGLIRRASDIVETHREELESKTGHQIYRSTVLRIAMERGMKDLERELEESAA